MGNQEHADPRLVQAALEQISKSEKERKIVAFRCLNQYAKKGQIVFAGSSLMEQFPIDEFIMDFELPLTIYNRGVGGFVCSEMLDALDECVIQLKPAHVYLNIGTNDLNDPLCDNAVLTSRYEPIVEQIIQRLPGVVLTLLAYYPVNPDIEDNPNIKELLAARTNERILSANVAVRTMAERLGARFLNVNKNLMDPMGRLKKEFTVEGVHIWPCGYEVVFRELLTYLLDSAKDFKM